MGSTRKGKPGKQNTYRGIVGILFFFFVVVVFGFQQWKDGNLVLDPAIPTLDMVITRSLPPAQSTPQGSALAVFFTDPLANASSGGIENELVAAINNAKMTIDIAIYNISLPNVTDALIAAYQRGVMVRMVMESEAMDGKAPQRLMDAGIEVIGDQGQGLMHNKFAVIDSQEVFTGSFNYTSTSSYNDFNNLVRIRSQRVAQDYAVEFNEMFVEGLFGPRSRANTPYPEVTIDGVVVEVYFSPDDGVTAQIVSEIEQAKKSITFMAYAFTSDPIAQAMFARGKDGVTVRGVFDDGQNTSNQGAEYPAFKKAGYDVRLDGISGLLHSKVIVIDGKTVITGSFNFSANAEKINDENIVIIHDAAIAKQFLKAFEPVYASSN